MIPTPISGAPMLKQRLMYTREDIEQRLEKLRNLYRVAKTDLDRELLKKRALLLKMALGRK